MHLFTFSFGALIQLFCLFDNISAHVLTELGLMTHKDLNSSWPKLYTCNYYEFPYPKLILSTFFSQQVFGCTCLWMIRVLEKTNFTPTQLSLSLHSWNTHLRKDCICYARTTNRHITLGHLSYFEISPPFHTAL